MVIRVNADAGYVSKSILIFMQKSPVRLDQIDPLPKREALVLTRIFV